jgi:hypothetical protein
MTSIGKKNCVFVKAAGRLVTKQSAAWYDKPFRVLIDEYFNTGDIAVYDSTLKLLDYDNLRHLDIDHPVDHTVAAAINEKYDYVCLRASNYIHEEMQWGNLRDWLEAVRLPVLCLGVGAQAAQPRKINLPAESRRIWHMIAERSPSIGVRGEFTASVLAETGVKNVEIVGCPTMFRSLSPTIELRHRAIDEIKRVGFSLRRETGENYTCNVAEFLDTQKRLILRLNEQFSLVVTAHGEVEEKIYYYNDVTHLEKARKQLIESNWFDPLFGQKLEQIYAFQLFFTPVVSHYDELVSSLHFTIGYRVHGVLPAIAMGTPSILLRYDARSAELAETFRVPILDPTEALKAPFESLFDRGRFLALERHYPTAYETMRAFLDKHQVAHCMKKTTVATEQAVESVL